MKSGIHTTASTTSIISENDQRYGCTAISGKIFTSMHFDAATTKFAVFEIISKVNSALPKFTLTAIK